MTVRILRDIRAVRQITESPYRPLYTTSPPRHGFHDARRLVSQDARKLPSESNPPSVYASVTQRRVLSSPAPLRATSGLPRRPRSSNGLHGPNATAARTRSVSSVDDMTGTIDRVFFSSRFARWTRARVHERRRVSRERRITNVTLSAPSLARSLLRHRRRRDVLRALLIPLDLGAYRVRARRLHEHASVVEVGDENSPPAGARSFRWRMYCLSGTSAVIRTPCTAETMTARGRGAGVRVRVCGVSRPGRVGSIACTELQ